MTTPDIDPHPSVIPCERWVKPLAGDVGMRHEFEQPPRVAFLLGKPVRHDSIFPEVFDLLRDISITTAVHLPKGDQPIPPWVFESALVVQRGLGLSELISARALEEAGIRCCNRVTATVTLHDRALTAQRLANAGLPVPATVRVATWPAAVELADGKPVAVKTKDGDAGRGVNVLIDATGGLPPLAPFPGPYILQEYVSSDGQDHKVYVAGDQTMGLLKRWPSSQATATPGLPFTVGPELRAIAQRAGQALDLEIYGVDVLYGPSGPAIVDVNPFPGFRNIPELSLIHI